MSGPPVPIDDIEREAGVAISAEPLFDLEDGRLEASGLLDELDVLEDAAEDQFAKGRVTRDTRLGMLIAVAALKDSVWKAGGGIVEDAEPGGVGEK